MRWPRWIPRMHYRRKARHRWSFYWSVPWAATSGINGPTLLGLLAKVWHCYFAPATIRKRAADVRFYRSRMPRWLYDIMQSRGPHA